jgi:hypothetical protein
MANLRQPKHLLLLAVLATMAVAFVVLRLRGDEDTWLCVGGEWVAHGHPAAARPAAGCPVAQAAPQLRAVPPQVAPSMEFIRTGNLVQAGDGWRLIYDEPGAPASGIDLRFQPNAVCHWQTDNVPCALAPWPVGGRAEVAGSQADGVLLVGALRSVTD